MEGIHVIFEKDGMQFEVSTTSEHYVQAVYALIKQGFEHLDEFHKLVLLGALYKSIKLYPEEDDYGDSEIYS